MSLIPENIWTDVTRLNPNMSGTPSSVNAQMKMIVPPANSPGMMSGSVILRNFLKPVQPRFSAASSIAGSTLAKAASTLR